jgi:hypothetical protein
VKYGDKMICWLWLRRGAVGHLLCSVGLHAWLPCAPGYHCIRKGCKAVAGWFLGKYYVTRNYS